MIGGEGVFWPAVRSSPQTATLKTMPQQTKKPRRSRVPRKTGAVNAQNLLERIDQHYHHLNAGLDALEARLEANGGMGDADAVESIRRKPR
ncbi:MAG: hypothetical protein CMJ70_25870 [Planctomycetaceae bacterium]|nr:hypothetical protein [Planctomycetaceae bacterium]